jgi:hypothetical protein
VTLEFVIGAYYRLFQIEKSFRMSQHDLQARPVYHHRPDSIEAFLAIGIRVGAHTLTSADRLTDDVYDALDSAASTQARTNLARLS